VRVPIASRPPQLAWKDVILFLEQLVAFEALRECAFAIDLLVGGERLILPLTVSKLSGIFGAPSRSASP
jgi:hypothetical protein